MMLVVLGHGEETGSGGWEKSVGPLLRCRPQPAMLMTNSVVKAI